MIAIKQAKFKPSNKIQENQIKNINRPSNVAQINNTTTTTATTTTTTSSNPNHQRQHQIHQHHQQQSNNQHQAYNQVVSSKIDDNNHQLCQLAPIAREQDDGPLKSSSSSNNNQHQQSNETRSETTKAEEIDGAATANAAPAPSKSPQPPKPSSSSATATTTSSLSTSAATTTTTAAAVPSACMAAVKQHCQQHHQPPPLATSLITASAKIQQRQQKFLAAAAKCSASPQRHSNQNLSVINQHAAQSTKLAPSVDDKPCCRIDAPVAGSASMSIIGGPVKTVQGDQAPVCPRNEDRTCQLKASNSRCAPAGGSTRELSLANEGLSSTTCSTAIETAPAISNCTADHLSDQQKQQLSQAQNQQTGCKRRQTMLPTTPSKRESLDGVARTKVLTMATMISGASCTAPSKNGCGIKAPSSGNGGDSVRKSQQASDDDHYRLSTRGCVSSSLTLAANVDPTVACDSGITNTTTTTSPVIASIGDINQEVTRSSVCDAGNPKGDYQQPQLLLAQNQPIEKRQSGENKEIDANINIKNTTKHNNHNHYHYNNHNYSNFHRHQQPHQNYFHLQYQAAQQHTTNSSNQLTTQHQQPVMAHYKFHNDCQSSVLTFEQVKRLDFVMDQTVPIYGRGNSPTLFVKLKELIRLVKYKLQHEHSIEIRDVRLNGGVASYVLAPENSQYNDLDLVFGTDLSNEDRFDVIRDVVLECLMEFYPSTPQAQQQQQQHHGEEQSFTCCGNLYAMDGSMRDARNCDSSGEATITANNVGSYEDEESCEHSSRSQRSSSFESDNLNITTNELDDESSDDDNDEVIVKIDSDEVSPVKAESGAVNEHKKKEKTHVLAAGNDEDDKHGKQCHLSDGHKCEQVDASSIKPTEYLGYQYQYNQMPPNNCAFKEAYVHKMVKVNDDDRWSLISLGVQQSETNHAHQQQASANCHQATVAPTGGNQQGESNHQLHHHQKQFPNSIELKFVDRMRRKFEFSVDSFQIILDSLIQFYDYAPQSTITIQRQSNSANPPTCPLVMSLSPLMSLGSCLQGHCEQPMVAEEQAPSKQHSIKSKSSIQTPGKKYAPERARCGKLNNARSFYQLPLEPGNSLSNSSAASSSGCSSSSSVVSSSSSSLSCDEDQEDPYCYVDNSPSSSASTSSLLSSTTTSGTGSPCDPMIESKPQPLKRAVIVGAQQNLQQVGFGQVSTNNNQVAPRIGFNALCDCHHLAINRPRQDASKMSSQRPQHHVNTRSYSEKLCDYGTSRISSCAVISENFYPTVIGRSEYGNFKEALYHLEKKLIATRSPEEIRGGGLLKYCNLLVKNYKPTNVYQIRTLERYMCSRFFIDFSDLNQQRAKLESYLANHFSDDPVQKFDYLTILHNVVQRSTVCLMNHELRLTLNMIRELAYNLNEQQQQAILQQQSRQQNHVQQMQRLNSNQSSQSEIKKPLMSNRV